MARHIAAVAVALLLSQLAFAGTGTWLAEVTTQDGDNIVEPGETASLRFLIDMSPDVRTIDPETGIMVQGFAMVWGDFLATGAWSSGQATWHINTDLIPLEIPTVDPATQSVLGVNMYQSDTFLTDLDDPVWIITLTWDPLGDYTPRRAGVLAHAADIPDVLGDQQMAAWEGYDSSFGCAFTKWGLTDAGFSFQVVPAPATGALLSLGMTLGARNRREPTRPT